MAACVAGCCWDRWLAWRADLPRAVLCPAAGTGAAQATRRATSDGPGASTTSVGSATAGMDTAVAEAVMADDCLVPWPYDAAELPDALLQTCTAMRPEVCSVVDCTTFPPARDVVVLNDAGECVTVCPETTEIWYQNPGCYPPPPIAERLPPSPPCDGPLLVRGRDGHRLRLGPRTVLAPGALPLSRAGSRPLLPSLRERANPAGTHGMLGALGM